MYNVLNQDGEKIQVEKINPQIHKHISGREFTEDDNFDFVEEEKKKAKPKRKKKIIIK